MNVLQPHRITRRAPSACPITILRRCSNAPRRKVQRRALSDVGLGGKDAALTIHDMRSLLECIQFVRRTAAAEPTCRSAISRKKFIGLLTVRSCSRQVMKSPS